MSDYFDRIERQLVARVHAASPPRERTSTRVSVVAAALLVAAVAGIFLGLRDHSPAGAPSGTGRIEFAFTASPSSASSLDRAAETLRRRLDTVYSGASVVRSDDRLLVTVPRAAGVTRAAVVMLAAPGRLRVYDWEASALTPSGKTVASALQAQDPAALTISQGAGGFPGESGAGSLPLYEAVAVASKAPRHLPLLGGSSPSYFLFGAPRSRACRLAALDLGVREAPAAHCLLAGPAGTPAALGLPRGVRASEVQELEVPADVVLVRAIGSAGQYFVLENLPSLLNSDITDPHAGTDPSGQPALLFDFTRAGRTGFRALTSVIARRGATVSGLGQTLDQHLAIVVDDRLLSVPSIDYKQYPNGLTGDTSAEITGDLTRQSARELAALLKFGPLPVTLRPL